MQYLLLLLSLVCQPLWAELSDYQTAYSTSFTLEQELKYKEAAQLLMDISTKYKDDYELNLRLGWLLYLSANYANSVKHLKRAIKAEDGSIEAKNMILLPLMAAKEWGEVERYANMVIKKEPTNYYANLRLAYTHYVKQAYANALDRYLVLHSCYPSDIDVKLGAAACYLRLNQKGKAAHFYNKILKVYPTHELAKQGYQEATK